jgi:Ca2+-binding RTX toxin-like protein
LRRHGSSKTAIWTSQFASFAVDLLVVGWIDYADDASGDAYIRLYDLDGNAKTAPIRTHADTVGLQQNIQLGVSPSGEIVVAWRTEITPGLNVGVYTRFDSGGVSIAGQGFLGSDTVGDIAVDAAGNAAIVYIATQSDSTTDITLDLINASGSLVGSTRTVNTTTSGFQRNPSLSMSPADGRFVVAWTDESGVDGSGKGVLGRAYDIDGTPLQNAEVVLSTTTAGDQQQPDVGVVGDGQVAIVYRSRPNGTDTIVSRLLDIETLTGSAETGVFSTGTGVIDEVSLALSDDLSWHIVANRGSSLQWTNVASALIVNGTANPDTIRIFDQTDATTPSVRVQLNGSDVTNAGRFHHVRVISLSGNDSITVADAGDLQYVSILAGDGNDTVTGSSGIEWVDLGAGNDSALLGAGNDYAFGSDGDDFIDGQAGRDTLTSGAGRNSLFGGEGDDRLNGSGGRDSLYGGSGDDRLYGNGGDDLLDGQSNVDRLFGGDGNDTLRGGTSNDKLYGGAGNDQLIGQSGADLLDGGPDADTRDIDLLDQIISIP